MHSSRIRSRADRLRVEGAIRPNDIPDDLPPAESETLFEKGFRIIESDVVSDDDSFECMVIDDWGRVRIWTRKYSVFFYQHADLEKMLFAPRNPPNDPGMAI